MVTSNVLQRTFHIRFGGDTGTAFTIDVEGRQYLVTARHVVDATGPVTIDIRHGGTWKALKCQVAGRGANNIDITVLAPSAQVSPSLPLAATGDGLILGSDVHFLGFPYGMHANVPHAINADFPLPLVKRACVSMLAYHQPDGDYLLLDGHNNPGFSGGPVVFHPLKEPLSERRVAAVVSGYKAELLPVIGGNARVRACRQIRES